MSQYFPKPYDILMEDILMSKLIDLIMQRRLI